MSEHQDTQANELAALPKMTRQGDNTDTTSTETPPTTFPLFRLPAEIRNRIYRHALHREETITVEACKRHRLPALVRASKQLQSETRQIFCEENEFLVRICNARLANREHWTWHLGSGKEAKLLCIGHPDVNAFADWMYRYCDGSIKLSFCGVATGYNGPDADYILYMEVYDVLFIMMDELIKMKPTNVTRDVITRIAVQTADTFRLVGVRAFGDEPVEYEGLSYAEYRTFDEDDWARWRKHREEAQEEDTLRDC